MAYMENRTFRVAERRRWARPPWPPQPMEARQPGGGITGLHVADVADKAVDAGDGTDGDGDGHQDHLLRDYRTVGASQVCAALHERSLSGLWSYPNSGVFAGRVPAVRRVLGRLRRLVLAGHFEDQGMFGLALLQHPRGAMLTDSNASLFASQFAYNAPWWSRPACFHDYYDANGEPPQLLPTGGRPFALHFNGPAGRHRLGWCIAATFALAAQPGQYYLDVDRGGVRVPLPDYCHQSESEAASHATKKGATPPPGRRVAQLPECASTNRSHAEQRPGPGSRVWTPLTCINDRCWRS